MKRADVLSIVLILLISFSVGLVFLMEVGILCVWKIPGKCSVYAQYYSESFPLIEGVTVTITDFYGHSRKVITATDPVYVMLYFKCWYKIEAVYGNSTSSRIITTVNAQYRSVGAIRILINNTDNTIWIIEYYPLPL